MEHGTIRETRERLLMSKPELARKAWISSWTIGRLEKGLTCRIATKRKIILAFGYALFEKGLVFTEDY